MVYYNAFRLGFIIILIVVLQHSNCAVAAKIRQSTDEAYVTLLYGDEFLLGVRVLGKSIRNTGSKKDMVVLVSDGVSDYAKHLLAADGWIVEMIPLLQNPNSVRPTRLWGVYTKLRIYNMTNYKKVVYLDADTIVVKNIDVLFKCGRFCANLKHSERFNSGVLVVEPSETLFNDMMSKVLTLPSYTGGDQGFLNSYYIGFANAQLFDPEKPKSRPLPEMQRLSTLYNADVGLYMLANKWMVDEKDLCVIHYTLGSLKPWDWWTDWLVKPVDMWQDIRLSLEDSLPGSKGGSNHTEDLAVKFLFMIPFLVLIFCHCRSLQEFFGSLCRSSLVDRMRHLCYRIRIAGPLAYTCVSPSARINANQQLCNAVLSKVPGFLGGMSILVCFLSAVLSFGIAVLIIPRQVTPWTGLILMYELIFTFFFMLFGCYLQWIYQWGKRRAALESPHPSDPWESLDDDAGKGRLRHSTFYDATGKYWLGMAFLAVAVPLLPYVIGVTALFLRLGLMVVGGFVLSVFMAYASEHLAINAFFRGLDDRDTSRTRNWCLFR